ncbi:MAG: hypothetical protein V4564_23300 [Pseudomonadota bacterium]
MDIRFCGNDERANPSGGLCDEYRLSGITEFTDLIAAYRRIAADHPGFRPLLTLDDFPQACYTSGHIREVLDLNDTTGIDLSDLPPQCFENGEHIGYLSTKAEFPIRARNFAKAVAGSSFADACDHGLTLDEEGWTEWTEFQDGPLSLLDQPLSALLAPVEHGHDALAAFPNGYFVCDLRPALTNAVARHFWQTHGYDLIGVGASYLGLLRAVPPDAMEAGAIAADFCALYTMRAQTARLRHVTRAITGRHHLWLRYTE